MSYTNEFIRGQAEVTKRREIYWSAYTVAKGLEVLMTAEEIKDTSCWGNYPLPLGFCCLMLYMGFLTGLDNYPELLKYLPDDYQIGTASYAYNRGDWKPRADVLLKAIRETYK